MQISAVTSNFAVQAPRVMGVGAPLTAAQAFSALQQNPGLSKIEITDSGANIQQNFDALTAIGAKLSKITISGPANPQINLTSSQYAAGTKTLAAIKSSYELKVTNVTMDQLNTVAANAKVKKIEVKDSSLNIGSNFQNLLTMPNKIDSIVQVGAASAIALTGDQFKLQTASTILGKVSGSYTLALRDVKIADLTTANGVAAVTSVAVKDTSANITADLALNANSKLSNSKVTSIVQTDASNAITVTDTQFQNNTTSTTLSKLSGTSSLAVTGVTASRAATVASNNNVKSLTVTDTAANVISNKVANESVSKISATNVVDSGANISTSFANLAMMSSISKIKLSDTANIKIMQSQLTSNSNMLLKVFGSNDVKGNYKLTVTNTSAADVVATAKLNTVDKINVTDSIANGIANLTALKSSKVEKIDLNGPGSAIGGANLDKLDSLGSKLNSVTNNGAGSIDITYDQYVKRSATLAKIDAGSFRVTDASASAAKLLKDDTKVSDISVKDSAANISKNYADLRTVLLANKLLQVKLSDSADIKLTATEFGSASGVNGFLSKVKDSADGTNFKLQITDALATNLISLYNTAGNFYNKVTKVSIKDTAGNIAAKLDDLGTAYGAGKLGAVVLTGAAADIAITKTQLLDTPNIAGALSKIEDANGANNYTLDVTEVKAADATNLINTNSKVAKLSISDTSDNISENIEDIVTLNAAKLKAITVSDFASDEIKVKANRLTAFSTILGKVTNGDYKLNVQDVGAAQAKIIADNVKVGHLSVKDAGTSISAKLADLNTLTVNGTLEGIKLNDASTPLFLSSLQYADGAASALTKITDVNYKLSISGVSVTDAIDSTKNVNADTHVTSYSVKDEGAAIVAALATLNSDAVSQKLQSINWTDTVDGNGDPISLDITGSDYHNYLGTLSKINGGTYDAHITDLMADDTAAAESDSNITQFSVKDSAVNLSKNMAALQASASAGTVKIQAIDIDVAGGDVAMTASTYALSTEALALMDTGAITRTVSDVAAADAAGLISGDDFITSISIADTYDNIAANLGDATTAADLDTNAAKISSIKITGGSSIALTGAQYADNRDSGEILDLLSQNTGGYHAVITDLASANVLDATADTNVDSFAVKDTAANLGGTDFANLVAADTKLTKIIQDGTEAISIAMADLFANAADYANTLNKFDPPPTITLTV